MSGPENYAPKGRYLWDPWFIKSGAEYHMFNLQSERNGDADGRHHNNVSIGHAVSYDLMNWEILPDALKPGSSGSWDEVSLWTGSVFKEGKKSYLFYTGRNQEAFWVQRFGLATSEDLIEWQKYPYNPVLQADNHYYHMDNSKNALGVVPAFRDPFVFKEGEKKYYMVFSARAFGQGPEYNGCIGLADSEDLLNWRLLPPILAPHRYDEMEVPQMVIHEGRYYLFFSAAKRYYEPEWAKQNRGGHGLHCYMADHLLGEYQPVNGTGVVLDNENLLGLRLIEKAENGYKSLGWLNNDEGGEFIGRLSDLKTIVINNDRIEVN